MPVVTALVVSGSWLVGKPPFVRGGRNLPWRILQHLTWLYLRDISLQVENAKLPIGQKLPKNLMTPWVLLVLKQWNIHGYLIKQYVQLNSPPPFKMLYP